MKPRSFLSLSLLFYAALCVWIPLTYGQEKYHGADSIFETKDMIIIWAILKGPDEEHSWVYIRIFFPGAGPIPWQSYGVGFQMPRSLTDLAPGGHFGLLVMRERADLIGARFDVQSEGGHGTRLTVRLAMPAGIWQKGRAR